MRGILTVFSTALGVVVFAALTWATWGEAVKKYQIGAFSYEQGIKVPIWPSYFILPAGAGLLALVLLWRLVAQLTRVEDPSALAPAAANDHMEEEAID